jgi:hypothetical protein
MQADPAILVPSLQDNVKLDRQAYVNAARRGNSLPLVSGAKEETSRMSLLEYAAFVLEQEACYCQQ